MSSFRLRCHLDPLITIGSLVKVQSEVRDALCDSFDTPGVMLLLATLVTNANKYIGMTQSNVLNFDILKMMAGYITKMFEVIYTIKLGIRKC